MMDYDDSKQTPLCIGHEWEEEQRPKDSLLQTWWKTAAWPGMGLFGESFILFSIGLMNPLWKILYPDCFSYQTCSRSLIHSLTYSVVLGVICGMIAIGYSANFIGRRQGSIATAALMSFASVGLTFISVVLSNHHNALFLSMSILLFIFGFGVGGEYPLSSSTATEKAMGKMQEKMKREMGRDSENRRRIAAGQPELPPATDIHLSPSNNDDIKSTPMRRRGMMVQLVFLSQGTGIMVNSLCLTILLALFGQFGDDAKNGNYSHTSLLYVWRITYAIGSLILTYVLVRRIQYLQESPVWADDKERRDKLDRSFQNLQTQSERKLAQPEPLLKVSSSMSSLSTPSSVMVGGSVTSMAEMVHPNSEDTTTPEEDRQASPAWLLFRNYGWRIFGSSLSWLLWDISFYGNKLFQSTFLLALTGDQTTLLELSGASLMNSFVALLGYIGAAVLLDHPRLGRLRLQQYGFLASGALFLACGFTFDSLASGWLVSMYFLSSFVGQLGPNATTFLIPAEIFPTEMRTLCHGIAAASGKIGALIAAVAFNYLSEVDMFMLSGYSSFAACIVTFWTIPDVTQMDLYEIDRKWRLTQEGRKSEYVGDANKPEFLSYYERTKRGLHA